MKKNFTSKLMLEKKMLNLKILFPEPVSGTFFPDHSGTNFSRKLSGKFIKVTLGDSLFQ